MPRGIFETLITVLFKAKAHSCSTSLFFRHFSHAWKFSYSLRFSYASKIFLLLTFFLRLENFPLLFLPFDFHYLFLNQTENSLIEDTTISAPVHFPHLAVAELSSLILNFLTPFFHLLINFLLLNFTSSAASQSVKKFFNFNSV